MNVQTLLDGLHRRGIALKAAGPNIRWSAPDGTITDNDLSTLRRHEPDVLAALREQADDAYQERAAIIQFDAHFSRREAEHRARAELPDNGAA